MKKSKPNARNAGSGTLDERDDDAAEDHEDERAAHKRSDCETPRRPREGGSALARGQPLGGTIAPRSGARSVMVPRQADMESAPGEPARRMRTTSRPEGQPRRRVGRAEAAPSAPSRLIA